jgi:putative FmdB family regulatory protein
MTVYEYRCTECGPFDVARPIGEARPEEPCRTCGDGARRVFTSPMLPRVAGALSRALGLQEASAHQPRVVREVPAERRSAASAADPRQAFLPKP